MKTLLFLFTFTLLFSACKQKTTTTQSALGSITGSCLIGKWSDSRLPLAIKLSSEFAGDIVPAHEVNGLNRFEQVAQAWNVAATPKTLLTVPFPVAATTGYADAASFKDAEIGIYKSHQWFTGVSSGAIAITQFYGVVTSSAGLGQYIDLTHADIMVNYRDFGSNVVMANAGYFTYDLPTIVLHELGHLVGLCHETVRPSIMAPHYVATQRSLYQFDKDIIKNIYIDGVITKNNNTNALSMPLGSEVKGTIELHADGKCIHYMNGKKTLEHIADNFRKKKLAQK